MAGYTQRTRAWVVLAVGIFSLSAVGCGYSRSYEAPLGAVRPAVLTHRVGREDTISSIAKRYGVTPAQIRAHNGVLRRSALRPGMVLTLPRGNRPLRIRPRGLSAWPIKGGTISSTFGTRKGKPHHGIDIAHRRGSPIYAVEGGKVMFAGPFKGYGNLIMIAHSGNLITVYAHQERNLVRVGQRVGKGQRIGLVGSTGRSTGPHLHFEVRRGNVPQDPLLYLPTKRPLR